MNIYERIKALRIAQGMSQEDLAKKVGYQGRSAISKVENGDRDITQTMIMKYANALGVPASYLLYGDESIFEQSDNTDTEILSLYSQLKPEQQQFVLTMIKTMLRGE